MKRERLTETFAKVIERVEQGKPPVRVKEIYVFGSYRRGALDCGDLDLIVVIEQPSYEWFLEKFGLPGYDSRVLPRFTASITKSLRKPGEKVEILLTSSLTNVITESSNVKPKDVLLVWSESDRDWRGKIDSIKLDSTAGRFHRDHLINIKRTGASLDEMNAVMWLLENQRLTLNRVPIEHITPKTPEQPRLWPEPISETEASNKTLRLLPYAFDWLRREGCEAPLLHQTRLSSETGTPSPIARDPCILFTTAWSQITKNFPPSMAFGPLATVIPKLCF